MAIVGSNILAGASGQSGGGAADTGYQIESSVRFNSADSAYFSRTPSSAGSRRTWTWSAWVKIAQESSTGYQNIFCAGTPGSVDRTFIRWYQPTGKIDIQDDGNGSATTSAVFRDPSAWYHFVLCYNTPESTGSGRLKFYVNGVEQTFSSVSYPAQNSDTRVNDTKAHYLGQETYTTGREFDGSLADVFFVDGLAVSASNFGKFDATTGAWQPIDFDSVSFPSNTLTPSTAEGALIIKANGATITGSVKAGGQVKIYTSPNGSSWTYRGLALNQGIGYSDKYIAIGGGGTNYRTFTADSSSTYTWAEYDADTAFDAGSSINKDVTGLTYSANGSVTKPYGNNGYHLDFSNRATTSTIGLDSSGNDNHWTANNITVLGVASPESGVITSVDASGGSGVKQYIWTGGGLWNGTTYTGTLPVNLADVESNGTLTTGQVTLTANQCLILVPDGNQSGAVFAANDGTLKYGLASPVGHYNSSGSHLGGGGSYGNTESTSFQWINTSYSTLYRLDTRAAYIVLGNRGTSGSSASAGTMATINDEFVAHKALTLDSTQQLDKFAVGDSVTQSSAYAPESGTISNKTESSTAPGGNNWNDNFVTDSGFQAIFTQSGKTFMLTGNSLYYNSAGVGLPSSNSWTQISGADTTNKSNNNVVYDGDQFIAVISSVTGGGNIRISYDNGDTWTYQSNSYTGGDIHCWYWNGYVYKNAQGNIRRTTKAGIATSPTWDSVGSAGSANDKRSFAAVGDVLVYGSNDSYSLSTNGGSSFTRYTFASQSTAPSGSTLGGWKDRSKNLLAVGNYIYVWNETGGCMRALASNLNGGANWSQVATFSTFGGSVAPDSSWYDKAGTIWCVGRKPSSSTNTIWYSTNGTTFTEDSFFSTGISNDWSEFMEADGYLWYSTRYDSSKGRRYPVNYSLTLTVSSNTDFEYFTEGLAVTQSDSAASGVVASVNDYANTIVLSESSGTWSTNSTKTVVGSSISAAGTITAIDTNTPSITVKDTTGTWAPNKEKYVLGPSTLSSTADADTLFDSPTNGTQTDTGAGGEVSGGYCVWNPLCVTTNNTLSNGNLEAAHTASTGWTGNPNGTGYSMFVGTMGVTSGKWYWEGTFTSAATGSVGIVNSGAGLQYYVGYGAKSVGYTDTYVYNNGFGSAVGSMPSYAQGDIIGVAIDMDNGKLYFSKNGTFINSGAPAAGTGNVASGLQGETIFPAVSQLSSANGISFTANFGQRPFAYTAPSGFKALCTANLPDPTIADGSTAMDVALYTGNGSTQSVTGLGISPDLVWLKRRNSASDHQIYDTVRGANNGLSTNLTSSEWNYGNGLTSFDSTGFSLGSLGGANASNDSHVAWAWDAGSSTVNTSTNDVTCSERANADAGFSIITYRADSTQNRTIPHSLGQKPGMILIKGLDQTSPWIIYHSSLSANTNLKFDTSAAAANAYGYINNVTSSSFDVVTGSSGRADVVYSNRDFIAYCWAPVESYSSFGSYIGTGTSDGPFIYNGMRPRWIMVKSSDTAGLNWCVFDTSRDGYNGSNASLHPDSSVAESYYVNDTEFHIYSNGFRPVAARNHINNSGTTFIYAAFGDPYKTARAR